MKLRTFLLPALAAVSLSACSGSMKGVVRGTGQPILFGFQQGMSSDILTAEIDGETFSGKAVMRGSSTTFGTAFGTVTSGSENAFGTANLIASTYTGDHSATLLGSKGSALSCQLQYADSSGFTSFGGVGVCQHSDGRIIDVLW